MFLTLDVGNTRLKWGLHDGARWVAQGAMTLGQIVALPTTLPATPDHAVIANVAGAPVGEALTTMLAPLGVPMHHVVPTRAQCGVTNSYDDPSQLGADRWAALIGAWRLHPGPSLVVMAGTATTVDVLDGNGTFQGGLILPGLELMRDSLARNTAQLPRAQGQFVALPRKTDDAIISGCLQAQLGAIERMFSTIANEPGARVLLSGGGGEALRALLSLPCRYIDNLVLEGLVAIGTAR